MTENNEKQEEPESSENSGEGVQPKATSKIEQAREERKEFERATDERKVVLEREEELASERALGGESEAGQPSVKETEDEKWAKEAKIRYEGTGMSPLPDEDGN